MVPAPFAVTAKRQDTADTWTLELEPLRRRAAARSRPASSRCSPRSAPARCRSRSAATPAGAGPLVHTVRAVGTGHAGDLRARRGDVLVGARPVRPALADRAARRGVDVVIVAGGIGLAPLRPAILVAARAPRALRAAGPALRRPRARPAAVSPTSSSAGASAGSRSRSPSTAPGRSGSATSAS